MRWRFFGCRRSITVAAETASIIRLELLPGLIFEIACVI